MTDAAIQAAEDAWRRGDPARARTLAEEVLQDDPANIAALMICANAVMAAEGPAAAEGILVRLAEALPGNADVLINLGHSRLALDQHRAAAEAFEAATEAAPENPRAWDGLGVARHRLGRYGAAREAHERAVRIDPEYAAAWCNLGIVLTDQGDFAAADDAFDRSLGLEPGNATARFNHGVLKLLTGDYAAGWPLYEARLALRGDAPPPGQKWLGQKLDGEDVFLFPEQGYGDFIQMMRFVPEVAVRGGRPVVAVPEALMALARAQNWPGELVPEAARPDTPYWCPLMSLPGVLGVRAETIYGNAYLNLPEDAAKPNLPDGPAVGLVWAGNPNHRRDRRRSLRWDDVSGLLEAPGVTFVSLQVSGPAGPGGAPDGAANLIDLAPELTDFLKTAEVIRGLDLVIAADTAVLHLAGALGVPVWGLLPHVPDWRWGLAADRSPWYASLRLFRQDRADDWPGVIARVIAALGEEFAG